MRIYVRKTGNDYNDGLTPWSAKLTITGALAVAASGDAIDIGAGTFTESVDAGTKSLLFVGAVGACLTTAAAHTTLTLGHFSRILGLKVENTMPRDGSTRSQAIAADGKVGIILRDTLAVCETGSAVHFRDCRDVVLENVTAYGSEYAVHLYQESGALDDAAYRLTRCYARTAAWDSCSTAAICIRGCATLRDCIADAHGAAGGYLAGGLMLFGGSVAGENNLFSACADMDGSSAAGVVVYDDSVAGQGKSHVSLTGGWVSATAAAANPSQVFDLYNFGTGTVLSVAGVNYDPTKTSGAILDPTSAAVSAIKSIDVDSTGVGLPLAKALEVLVAVLAGKAAYNAATGVWTCYGLDGETIIGTTTLTGSGNRTGTTIT